MKVGIITLFGYENYGNRLQNYAVQEILRSHGMEVRTIRLFYRENEVIASNKIIRLIKRILPLKVIDCIRNTGIKHGLGVWKSRYQIGRWSRKHIPVQKIVTKHYKDLSKCEELSDYDYFVVGSDQVWNPDLIKQDYWLDFAPMEKRVGFIASIGVEKIDPSLQDDYRIGFQGMNRISVREQSAVGLIQEISGVYAECFFDPVLLIGKDCWEKCMEAPSNGVPQKYLLCFFLGEVDINKIRDTYGNSTKVIYIPDPRKKQNGRYGIGEFIFLFAHADYVFTDSFHGTVLSVLFHRSFYAFNRVEQNVSGMMTRLESMLGELCLIDRISDFESLGCNYDNLIRISDKDYEHTDQVIENKRIAFDRWIQEVFK